MMRNQGRIKGGATGAVAPGPPLHGGPRDDIYFSDIKYSLEKSSWFKRDTRILLWSEIPSGVCAELRTVAASNNRGHPTRSLSSSPFANTINCSPGSQALLEVIHQDHSIGITLLLLVRATYIMLLFFTHIPFVVNHTINATPPERLQQYNTIFRYCVELSLIIFLQVWRSANFSNHYWI